MSLYLLARLNAHVFKYHGAVYMGRQLIEDKLLLEYVLVDRDDRLPTELLSCYT